MKYLIFLSVTFSLVACKKDAFNLDFTPDGFVDCYDNEGYSKEKLASAMAGNWEWQYISCYWTPEDANSEACESCELRLGEDGNFNFVEDGAVSLSGTWTLLESFSAGYYTIQTSPSLEWALGQVYLCDDQLLFFNSYIDGCDNYYNALD